MKKKHATALIEMVWIAVALLLLFNIGALATTPDYDSIRVDTARLSWESIVNSAKLQANFYMAVPDVLRGVLPEAE